MKKVGSILGEISSSWEPEKPVAQPGRQLSRLAKKAESLAEVRLSIRANAENLERTEALIMARVLAMAGLPRTRTKKKTLVRILRLGPDRWVKITYTTVGDELPFGQDRAILAAIQHLALSPDDGLPSAVVRFKTAAEFLRIFDLADTKYYYQRLRAGFKRLSKMLINIEEAPTQEALMDSDVGHNLLVVRNYRLPSRKDLISEGAGQLSLAPVFEGNEMLYGVKLDEEFFQLLRDELKQLIVPIKIMKRYTDSPAKWDFALFMLARAGVPFCRSRSKIDHDTLVGLFRDGKEREPDVIRRLQGYLDELHQVTDNRLNAVIIRDGFKPKKSGQRGPRSKRWAMIVEPGMPVVWSGKKERPGDDDQNLTFDTREETKAFECLKRRFPRGITPDEIAKGVEWPEIALSNLVYLGVAKESGGVYFLNA